MAGLRLAAVAFHLCLLLSPSSSLRWLHDAAESNGGSRTAYHFQPAKNWQNDPNGPMYHDGVYHLFYQYNPHGASWGNGNLSWGHSVSVDLVNWTALDPDSPLDANGCWSGSATILSDGNPVMLYTGIDAAGNQHDNFRDPSTAWLGPDGLWRVAVSAKFNTGAGSALIYRSKDFRRWERNAVPLYESRATGMVECPDLFPVAEPGAENGLDYLPSNGAARHVLKLSVVATLQDYYMVGRYDDTTDTFVLAVGADNDSRTWRRVQVLLRRAQEPACALGLGQRWPIEEIETLRKMRFGLPGAEVNSGGMNEIIGMAGSQADVEVVFEIPALEGAENLEPNGLLDPQKLCGEKGASVSGGVGPFGLVVLAAGSARSGWVFKHDGKYKVLMCTDLTRSTTRADVYKPSYGGFVDMDIEETKSISLRTLIDHSVVESFGGWGRTCITARVYPEHTEMSNNHLYMFNNGTDAVKVSKLEAWELATATVNDG
ncbi:unnamed protein product [Alopecurus aequalis]